MLKKLNILGSVICLQIFLYGCKPSESRQTPAPSNKVSAHGQVFIVTRGAENIKLGDVRVLLVEKKQVVEFLQKRQAVIEQEIASRQRELAAAKENSKKITAAYQAFLADKPNRMENSGYNTIKKEQEAIVQELAAFDQKLKDLPAGAQDEVRKVLKQIEEDYGKQISLKAKADAIETTEKAEAEKHFAALNAAQSTLTSAKEKLAAFPAIEDYLADFSPVALQETLTDADGKFLASFPADKPLTVFAAAQRATLNGIEKYYWLVDAPTGAETAQILLSNNRLVSADPDGYFKSKPKTGFAESPTQ